MHLPYLTEAIQALIPIHERAIHEGDSLPAMQGGVLATMILSLELLAQNNETIDFADEGSSLIYSVHAVFGLSDFLRQVAQATKDGNHDDSIEVPARLLNTTMGRKTFGSTH
jgi:hypothetical protein